MFISEYVDKNEDDFGIVLRNLYRIMLYNHYISEGYGLLGKESVSKLLRVLKAE